MKDENIKILLVDDEPDILELLKYNFNKEHFKVYTATNGINALEKAINVIPNIIILDVMMPKLDGIEVCRILRKKPEFEETIIVFLTARGEDYSEIAGFDAGGDDYITKPLRPRVLITRVKALLKRKQIGLKYDNIIDLGGLTINTERRVIKIGKLEKVLTKKEYELLRLLSSKPGKVFLREEIYLKIWGNDIVIGDRTLDVHILKLRRSIGKSFIKTVKGVGYYFNPDN